MLAIHQTAPQKCTPNLLPARINHAGPIHDTSRYWKPSTDEKGTQHVHFRGRHLHGTSVSLPANYTGAVLNVTEKLLPQEGARSRRDQNQAEEHEEDMEEEAEETEELEEVKIANQVGTFDQIIVWEHGGAVDVERDAYVRGLGEWIGFAESMHCDGEDGEGDVESKRTS